VASDVVPGEVGALVEGVVAYVADEGRLAAVLARVGLQTVLSRKAAVALCALVVVVMMVVAAVVVMCGGCVWWLWDS
jgi:hypothetical protein